MLPSFITKIGFGTLVRYGSGDKWKEGGGGGGEIYFNAIMISPLNMCIYLGVFMYVFIYLFIEQNN